MEIKVPDCHKCKHHRDIPKKFHSRCTNKRAKVAGDPHGIKNGWFMWPYNFDSRWLTGCNGFENGEEEK